MPELVLITIAITYVAVKLIRWILFRLNRVQSEKRFWKSCEFLTHAITFFGIWAVFLGIQQVSTALKSQEIERQYRLNRYFASNYAQATALFYKLSKQKTSYHKEPTLENTFSKEERDFLESQRA